MWEAEGNGETCLWRVSGEQQIAEKSEATSAWFEPLGKSGLWMSATDFPKLEFTLESAIGLSANASHQVRVELRVTETMEYILAHQKYLVKVRQQQQLEKDLARTLHHLESARTEIADIKAGKPFRLGMKIFSMLSIFRR